MKPTFKNPEDSSKLERKLLSFKFEDIVLNEKIYKRANGLGIVREGVVGNIKRNYCFRIIEMKQLSTYVIEEALIEVKKINEL
jgi:hypothetical protein